VGLSKGQFCPEKQEVQDKNQEEKKEAAFGSKIMLELQEIKLL